MVIDLHDRASFADYLIVATGTSSRHVVALSKHVSDFLRAQNKLCQIEGKNGDGNWVVVDTGDVIIHLFSPENRLYYGIEDMWKQS